MIYAGIGARQTPKNIMDIMFNFANFMAKHNHVLRSGAADGADKAFEAGCDISKGSKEIYLPWEGFNNNVSPLFTIDKPAFDLAKQYHPAWSKLSLAAQKLMARNSYQILGRNLKLPVDFVVCWTKDGYNLGMPRSVESGGTGQAIEIALCNEIKVYNLYNPEDLKELRSKTVQFRLNT